MTHHLSLLQNYEKGRHYYRTPFPHVIIENALPKEVYTYISCSFPQPEQIARGAPYAPNSRYDLDARFLLPDVDNISIKWREFISYHCSSLWWEELVEVFGPAILETYGEEPFFANCPSVAPEFGDLEVGVRNGVNYKRWDIHLDAKPGINTPVEEEGRVRGPHVDNPHQIIGGLFYMRMGRDDSTGGDLILYKWKDGQRPTFHTKAEIYDDLVEEVAVVPYAANTLVLFLNSDQGVHGVSPRCSTRHFRRLVNLIAETPSKLFTVPKSKRKPKR